MDFPGLIVLGVGCHPHHRSSSFSYYHKGRPCRMYFARRELSIETISNIRKHLVLHSRSHRSRKALADQTHLSPPYSYSHYASPHKEGINPKLTTLPQNVCPALNGSLTAPRTRGSGWSLQTTLARCREAKQGCGWHEVDALIWPCWGWMRS
jgi:hypothetical protein